QGGRCVQVKSAARGAGCQSAGCHVLLPLNKAKTAKCSRLAIAAAILCATVSLQAQWVQYPSAGVPRTPAGSPDMSAPAPKTADGTPDLSGVWVAERTRPCAPEGCDD